MLDTVMRLPITARPVVAKLCYRLDPSGSFHKPSCPGQTHTDLITVLRGGSQESVVCVCVCIFFLRFPSYFNM